ARFDGNLRRRDLAEDTPHNTYTRAGLPPTPIALVSQASLDAVLHPPETKYLYFVSRNDGSGSSEFSETLDRHNRAVARYILKRRQP
ncbi:MAG: endolytic transglycosylase MltG, partial [Burkholderiales bacterium]|nr:endolytic transglycosylase MltG [Burkholderiales bacterium]